MVQQRKRSRCWRSLLRQSFGRWENFRLHSCGYHRRRREVFIKNYLDVITDTLENCTCLVLLLTNASQSSVFVKREVERAITYRKPIIPLQMEDLELNSVFKFFIEGRQFIEVPEIKRDSPYVNRAISAILTNCQELSTSRITQ